MEYEGQKRAYKSTDEGKHSGNSKYHTKLTLFFPEII